MLKHLPNFLTIVRMLLVVPFVIVLYNGHYLSALTLLFVAGVTDGLDGFLARQFGWYSWFGSVADPIADKLLLVASYVVLGMLGHIPIELTYLVVGRDALIFSGAGLYWFFVGRFEGRPTLLGKLCTFVMIVQGLLVLTSLALFEMPSLLLTAGNAVVAVLCVVSGVHYVYIGIMEINAIKSKPSQ